MIEFTHCARNGIACAVWMDTDCRMDIRVGCCETDGFSARPNVVADADKLDHAGGTCPEEDLKKIWRESIIRQMDMSIYKFQCLRATSPAPAGARSVVYLRNTGEGKRSSKL